MLARHRHWSPEGTPIDVRIDEASDSALFDLHGRILSIRQMLRGRHAEAKILLDTPYVQGCNVAERGDDDHRLASLPLPFLAPPARFVDSCDPVHCVGKFAVFDIEFVRRRPTEIYGADYELLHFDRHGRLDREREAEYQRLGDRIQNAILRSTERRPFAGHDHPTCKRMVSEFRWTPAAQVKKEMQRLVLAPRKARREATPLRPASPPARSPLKRQKSKPAGRFG